MDTQSNKDAAQALISAQRMSKRFNTPRGEVTVLRNIDISVKKGQYIAIVGKSGSGKTTLLNMLAAIDKPTTGTITVDGTELRGLSERQAAIWRGRHIGIVFQFYQLLPGLTVLENIMLPMDFCASFKGERKDRAMALLESVGLAAHADKVPTRLSGGEQQRVAIARALANDPPIILADEPTGNLDSETSASINELFNTLSSGGKTVLVVTHGDLGNIPYTRVVEISDGRIKDDTVRAKKGGEPEGRPA